MTTSAETLKPNKVLAWPSEGITPALDRVVCWALVKSLQKRTPLSPCVMSTSGGGAEPLTTMSSTSTSSSVLVNTKGLPDAPSLDQPVSTPE